VSLGCGQWVVGHLSLKVMLGRMVLGLVDHGIASAVVLQQGDTLHDDWTGKGKQRMIGSCQWL